MEVIIDRGEMENQAVKAFDGMKDNPKFKYGHRLESCKPASAEEMICLQPADFVAYETFRLMHGKKQGVTEMRKALSTMLGTTGSSGISLRKIHSAASKMTLTGNPANKMDLS